MEQAFPTALGDEIDEYLPFQTYQTTISQPGGPSAEFLTIPARALFSPQILAAPEAVFEELGLPILQGFYLSELPQALWTVLSNGQAPPDEPREDWPTEARAVAHLCEHLTFRASIPFEFSDQKSAALGAVAAAGAAAGGKVGFLLGTPGGPPLIAVATAGGVVIGGLVGAVTWALSDRLGGLLRRP
jgi:hypothetical protein